MQIWKSAGCAAMKVACLIMGLVLACGPAAAQDRTTPPPPPRPATVRGAIFADGRLWVLTGDQVLTTITERPLSAARAYDGEVRDICRQGRKLLILAAGDAPGRWWLRRRSASGWQTQAVLETGGDPFFGLICKADSVTLLTHHKMIRIDERGRQRITILSQSLEKFSSYEASDDTIFLGYFRGEFGGSLWRLDPVTGVVSGRNGSGTGICGEGWMECRQVTDITPSPWRRDCVVVTVGLEHMGGSRGRVVEVCGQKVRLLYDKAATRPMSQWERNYAAQLDSEGAPRISVAFYKAWPSGRELWALGHDGLYSVAENGVARDHGWLPWQFVGDFAVSFADPAVVAVKRAPLIPYQDAYGLYLAPRR